jgi:putative transcriptional regulator
MSKRKIFDEMIEGVAAMKSHREGKTTLRTYKIEAAPRPRVDSKLIRDTRKRLRCSRAVFARKTRYSVGLWVGNFATEVARASYPSTYRREI